MILGGWGLGLAEGIGIAVQPGAINENTFPDL